MILLVNCFIGLGKGHWQLVYPQIPINCTVWLFKLITFHTKERITIRY